MTGLLARVDAQSTCSNNISRAVDVFVSIASFPGPARSSLAVRNSRRGPGFVHHVLFLPVSKIQHAGCMFISAQHAQVEVVLTQLSVVCNTWCVLFLGLTFNTRRVLSGMWNDTYRVLKR